MCLILQHINSCAWFYNTLIVVPDFTTYFSSYRVCSVSTTVVPDCTTHYSCCTTQHTQHNTTLHYTTHNASQHTQYNTTQHYTTHTKHNTTHNTTQHSKSHTSATFLALQHKFCSILEHKSSVSFVLIFCVTSLPYLGDELV